MDMLVTLIYWTPRSPQGWVESPEHQLSLLAGSGWNGTLPLSCLSFQQLLGKALGGGVCCGGYTLGRVARGRCKPQTPSVPPKARPEPPGACVWSQQTPGGADRCLSHPATPVLPGLLGRPKPPN